MSINCVKICVFCDLYSNFCKTVKCGQASQGDIAVGLYSWAHNLLPVVGNKNCNPQSRDLILQLVEK